MSGLTFTILSSLSRFELSARWRFCIILSNRFRDNNDDTVVLWVFSLCSQYIGSTNTLGFHITTVVKQLFPLEIAYLIDSLKTNFITSSVKNFSNNETGGSTVFSTQSGRVHLKPNGSDLSEWIHLFTFCELSFFRCFAFWTSAFVAVSSLYITNTFPLRHFISNTAELKSWLPLRLLVSTAAVFSSSESTSLLGLLELSGGWW